MGPHEGLIASLAGLVNKSSLNAKGLAALWWPWKQPAPCNVPFPYIDASAQVNVYAPGVATLAEA